MKKKLFCFVLLIPIIFLSCNPSKQQPLLDGASEQVEYPVGYIAQSIKANLTDSHELYPLSEEFLDSFTQMHTQYEGTRPTLATDFPKEWGVVIVERLPEGRELYQIQSLNREWIFLVITSGFGTLRVLDVLPIAVNLAIQKADVLETEIWTTERDADGAFTVTKKYEWVRSVENVSQQEYDANPQNYLRSKTITDKYFINDFYRFEKKESEDVPNYSAVFFYYKNEKPEDWDEVADMMQAFCEDYDLLFDVVHGNFNNYSLYDYKLSFITELDFTPYTNLSEGVIFMKKGEVTRAVPFGSYERIISEIKRYFKIVEA